MKYLLILTVLLASNLTAQTQVRFANDHPQYKKVLELYVDNVSVTTDIHYSTVYYLPFLLADGTYQFAARDEDGYTFSGHVVVQCQSTLCNQIVYFTDLRYVVAPPPTAPPTQNNNHQCDESCSTGEGSRTGLVIGVLLIIVCIIALRKAK